jgi:hydroxyacylglutathione hydrolase
MEIKNTWFLVRELDEQTWAINDHGHSLIYLLAGRERALLIDTGWGVGDLPALVSSLTPLPLTVVNTHGHPDHFCGNGAFGLVHVNQADRFLIMSPSPGEITWIKTNMLSSRLPEGIVLDDWRPDPGPVVEDLDDGVVFNLGGRTLEVITLPGHSPGSVCLLERPDRRLFTGDSVLPCVWVHLEESVSLPDFHRNLLRLRERCGPLSGILPGHGNQRRVPLPPGTLDELTAGIGRILSGELVGRPESNFAGEGLRCDFGISGVIYRAAIFPEKSRPRQ